MFDSYTQILISTKRLYFTFPILAVQIDLSVVATL